MILTRGVKIFIGIFVFVAVILGIGSVILAPLNSTRFSGSAGDSASFSGAPTMTGGVGRESSYLPPYYDNDGGSPELKDRQVIRTANLALIVHKAEEASSQIESIATSFDGFVERLNLREVSDGVKNGSMVIRVPQKSLSAALSDIKKIAVKVESESVDATDVTDQIVDIDARLLNLRAAEKQYREIMDHAVNIEDVLRTQEVLTSVRGQIETLEAQKKSITGRVSHSRVSITLTSEPDVKVFGITWRPLYVAKQAVRDSLENLRGFTDWLIKFVIALPVLILQIAVYLGIIFIIFLLGRKGYNWIRRRYFQESLL